MEIKYVGPFEEVQVSLPDGSQVSVKKGKSYDFPSEMSDGLLEQEDNWERANKPGPKEG